VTTVSTSIETEFVDNLRESADALEAVVRAERQRLKRSLDELGSAVREKVNVRSKLRGHPLITVGASLGAGIALGVINNRVTDRCDARSDAFVSPAPKTHRMHHATSSQTQFSGTLGIIGIDGGRVGGSASRQRCRSYCAQCAPELSPQAA